MDLRALGYHEGFMRRYAALVIVSMSFCGCKPPEGDHVRAIVGAVLIDGLGGPPMSDSVVVVAGDRIREAGPRANVLIPDNADKIDGSGKYLVPSPLDVYPSAEAARSSHALQIFKIDREELESAHDAGTRVIGHVSTQADVRALVDGGAVGFVGMITDTEDLDPALVSRLRNLRIFFAPALVSQGPNLEVAHRNTRRLFIAGVPIALASNGGDAAREPELLADAGIPALDVIVAITENTAGALAELDQTGTIQAGKRADLLLLSANPGEDIRNLRKVAQRMSAGEWVK